MGDDFDNLADRCAPLETTRLASRGLAIRIDWPGLRRFVAIARATRKKCDLEAARSAIAGAMQMFPSAAAKLDALAATLNEPIALKRGWSKTIERCVACGKILRWGTPRMAARYDAPLCLRKRCLAARGAEQT